MGEAKRRKEKDLFYGKKPKAGKGIIISPPVTIRGNESVTLKSSMVDPGELRRAVLFWDRIVKPLNTIILTGMSYDEEILIKCGLLSVIKAPTPGKGFLGPAYAQAHMAVFNQLEKREPGLWCMSEGENSFNYIPKDFAEGRGALLELHRAIPLPTADVALEDLLNFKEKRRDELLSLTIEIDSLFSRVANAQDVDFELQRAIREIDQRCSDVIAVGKESKVKFSLSNISFDCSLEFNSTNLLASSLLGNYVGGATFGLPEVGALLGASASFIKLNVGFGGRLERSRKAKELAFSPYRVVSRLINEPI